jgi:UDPglucose--hexose-1-phosphate uridylyltransferase
VSAEKRIVLDSPHFTAFCPYASRFPFETWIVPKSHASHFENIPKPGVDDLGQVLHQVLSKLETALDSPSYNYIIHTAPFDHSELPHYHWHIEVIPRLTKVAGFEWGSGFYVNPVPPEHAAAFLREVDLTPSRAHAEIRERTAGGRLQPIASRTS